MGTIINVSGEPTNNIQLEEVVQVTPGNTEKAEAFIELEQGIHAALETYSNVHRGSGLNSIVTTYLYDHARDIVLEYLCLKKGKYIIIFCTPHRATKLIAQLEPKSYKIISSQDIGLSIGVRALAVKRKVLPKGVPFQSGGGTTRLISKEWVIWADAPSRFEAGTPAIINVIAFARALNLVKQSGKDIFQNPVSEKLTAGDILYHDELEKYSGLELLENLRQTLIGRDVRVPTLKGPQPFINLDNSASTPTFTPVWNAFQQALHQPGKVKQEIIYEVKSIISGMLDAPLAAYDMLFTSNTTEAINLAAVCLSQGAENGTEPVVLNTLSEHSSNELPWRMIPGYSLIRLSVDDEGFIDLNELETVLKEYNQESKYDKKRIKLVAISGASNVLGVCNNLEDISRVVHNYGANLLVDAAQLVAHRKIEMERCGIDYLAFSAHKIYAPFGCGVLISRKGLLNFNPAELELIQSSGEENAAGIAALGKALVLLQRIGMDLIHKEEQALTKRALLGMKQIEGLRIFGVQDPDSPGFADKIGVIAFSLKNIMPNKLADKMALQGGIGVRFGCHCAHIIVKRLLNVGPSLERFQRLIQTLFPKITLPGLTRVSLGIENNEKDVDQMIQVLEKIANKKWTSADKQTTSTLQATPGLSRAVVQKRMNDFINDAVLRVYS